MAVLQHARDQHPPGHQGQVRAADPHLAHPHLAGAQDRPGQIHHGELVGGRNAQGFHSFHKLMAIAGG
jgi:hypothetical protein